MNHTCKVAVALFALTVTSLHADELTDRFRNPPAEARPWVYWYWMNGNVTREGIRADMQGFADVGVGGAVIAFPTPEGDEPLPKPQRFDTDGKPLPANATVLPPECDLVFPQPVAARSIVVRVGRATGDFNAELSADGRMVARFRSHISGPFSAHIGSASFAPVRASKFRLKSGKPAARAMGVKILRMEDNAAVYAVDSGTYRFDSSLADTVK